MEYLERAELLKEFLKEEEKKQQSSGLGKK
jgi:hypothetical protein